MLSSAVILLCIFSTISAQTCPDGQTSLGPCEPNCPPGSVCNTDLKVCCPMSTTPGAENTSKTPDDGFGNVLLSVTRWTRGPDLGGPVTGSCLDKVNPRTGLSDCPFRRQHCEDNVYRQVMTEQCPKTCNRCSPIVSPPAGCVDLVNPVTRVSDCSSRSSYCKDSAYVDVMRKQCRKTCGWCGGNGTIPTMQPTILTAADRG
ncbi:hypothetical protein Q1695_002413 [Nippostrongylus brasiliensis]|nr:hypothetical protein Q1695_002413 [Nippostrongylus brasiliensis]